MKHYKQEIMENEGTWLEVDEIHSIKLYSNNGIRFTLSPTWGFFLGLINLFLPYEKLEVIHN